MKSLQNKIVELQCKSLARQAAMTSEQKASFKKMYKLMTMVVCCMSIMMSFACCVFAADGIDGGIKNGMLELFRILKAVIVPVAAVTLAFAGFQILAGGEKGMETGKKLIISVAIAVGIVYLAPTIVNTISTWFTADESAFN